VPSPPPCLAVQELAYTIQQLEAQEAPGPALEAVQGLLGQLVAAGVQQLAGQLHAVPAWLIAREGWQLSVTHSGSQPITMMPEQLQVGPGCRCVSSRSVVSGFKVCSCGLGLLGCGRWWLQAAVVSSSQLFVTFNPMLSCSMQQLRAAAHALRIRPGICRCRLRPHVANAVVDNCMSVCRRR
jgi:hypothetical protein